MNIQVLLQTDILPRAPNFRVGSPITFLAHTARFTTREDVISVGESTQALKPFWNIP